MKTATRSVTLRLLWQGILVSDAGTELFTQFVGENAGVRGVTMSLVSVEGSGV